MSKNDESDRKRCGNDYITSPGGYGGEMDSSMGMISYTDKKKKYIIELLESMIKERDYDRQIFIGNHKGISAINSELGHGRKYF